MALSLILACSPSPCAEGYGRLASGACVLLDDGGNAGEEGGATAGGGGTDSAGDTDGAPMSFALGDPLATLGIDGRYQESSPENPWGRTCHLTDVGAVVVDLDEQSGVYNSYGVDETGMKWAPFPLHVVIDRDGVITWLANEADPEAAVEAIEAARAEKG